MALDADLLRRVNEDRALASVLLFKHRHPQAEAPMHVEMMDLFRSADEFVVLEAFREAGKTTKMEEHLILGGCFGNYAYCLLIGETFEKAKQRLDAIGRECRNNRALKELFGGPVLEKKIENKLTFRSGSVIEILGWDQEFQSFKEGSARPDFAYLDDVENNERVRDKAAVQASMDKLYYDLIPAMDKEHIKIVVGQVRRAEDCMITRLAHNPEWVYRAYPICDGDPDDPKTLATWPARYPMAWVRERKRNFVGSGALSAFLQAYMLQAVNPLERPFKEEDLSELALSPYHWMPRYAIYDPSRSTHTRRTKEHERSDQTGKVVVSRMGSQILVHESGGFYWQPDAFIEDLFAVQQKHAPAKIAIEKNSLDDWLLQPVRLAMLKKGVSLPLAPLQAPQDRNKDEFIMGLQPHALARDIVLVGGKLAHPQLTAEWTNFPQGPRNIMNALAYAMMVFAGEPMYADFSAQNIAEAPAPRPNEAIHVGFNATPTEVVAVALVREGRRLCVSRDFSATGALSDAVRTLAFELRATFPRAKIECWVPADTYDQHLRVALVPALRAERFVPYRAEHIAPARGCLSERIRTRWHHNQLLTVDRAAKLTLNALSAGYALPVEKGGRIGNEPETGTSRLIAEALECMVAVLDRQMEATDTGYAAGANLAVTPGGKTYVSANPVRMR